MVISAREPNPLKVLAVCLAVLPICALAQDSDYVVSVEAQETYETVLRAHARDYVAVRIVTTTHRPHVMTWHRSDGANLTLVDRLALKTFEPHCVVGKLEDVTYDVAFDSVQIRFECNSARLMFLGQHPPPKTE